MPPLQLQQKMRHLPLPQREATLPEPQQARATWKVPARRIIKDFEPHIAGFVFKLVQGAKMRKLLAEYKIIYRC